MCGINGIFAYHYAADPVDAHELIRTRDHMAKRGPDGFGAWYSEDGRLGLGHRRLSIIDLSEAGAQPMLSADGRFAVTFNGEIYNYRELRQKLEATGTTFRSRSDTEVLLQLYAEKGAEMVHALRGMFAFAIWDVELRRLLLVRDPYGIKPLYYADNGRTFRFASQVKALIAGGAVPADVDDAGLVGFHLFGSVPEPLTIMKGIRALPAGCTLIVGVGRTPVPHRYHSIAAAFVTAERNSTHACTADERRPALRAALLDSVRHHLVADVPVGAFLSAGIDSSALVGLMRDAGQSDVETMTLSFEEFRGSADDEAPLAAQTARLYGTQHTTRVVTRGEFEAELPHILAAMDQPSIDGINSWFVSKAAHERGLKVAISGLGGDELFGGYPAFGDIPRWVGFLALPASIPYLGSACRKLAVALGAQRMGLSPKAPGMLEYGGDYAGAWLLRRGLFMPWELDGLLDREVVREGLQRLRPLDMVRSILEPMPGGSFARVATLEAALYMRNQLLRDADWASMAHSVEVRTPLADATLLQTTAALGPPLADQPSKIELALAPAIPLPKAIVERKKTGFGVPVAAWLPSARSAARHSAYGYAREWARFLASEPRLAAPAEAASSCARVRNAERCAF
jgi:asparagine synthase (glutamine-hydrolysing)